MLAEETPIGVFIGLSEIERPLELELLERW